MIFNKKNLPTDVARAGKVVGSTKIKLTPTLPTTVARAGKVYIE